MRRQRMAPEGLEPPTPTMSTWCSNQLSYGAFRLTMALEWYGINYTPNCHTFFANKDLDSVYT